MSMKQYVDGLVEVIIKKFPYLKNNLLQAGMAVKPETFVKKKLVDALIVSITITLTLFFLLFKNKSIWALSLAAFIPIYLGIFMFLLNTPKVVAMRKVRDVDREITYAGRFLLIELSAGVSLFDAIKDVAENFEYIGKHFKSIIKRVDVGKPLEQALNEVMDLTPSDNFRKLLFTIVNSLKTGADVSQALEGLIEQISREKLIKLKEYGKKINPTVMFYLIVAVIAPSLGIAIMTLLSSFVGISFSLGTLLGVSLVIIIIQLSFITILDNLRKGI